MESLIAFFHQHEVFSLVVCYVFFTFLNSLPEPGQRFDAYSWFFHSVKQCLSQVPAKYQPKDAVKS